MQLKHQNEKKLGSLGTWSLADPTKVSRNKGRIKIKDLSQGYSSYSAALTTHPQLAPRLEKEKSYTSATHLALHIIFLGELCHLKLITQNCTI